MKTPNRAVPAGNLASLNRRDFLRAAGQTATALAVASTAAPAILSAPAPGRTLGVGCIGIGTRGGDLLNAVVAAPGVKVVAVSDVYGPHRQKGLERSQNPEARSKKAAETGVYYRLMVEQLKKVLADPKRVFPAYDEKQGCEVAGFVWLQGWNELVDGDVYPERHKPGGYAAYSQALAHFVRDVRKDLNAPEMPFVIGVMRSGGLKDKSVDMLAFRQAMAVPAAGPEFKAMSPPCKPRRSRRRNPVPSPKSMKRSNRCAGFSIPSTRTTQTRTARSRRSKSGSLLRSSRLTSSRPLKSRSGNAAPPTPATAYLGCAKTFALKGQAFAEANLNLLEAQRP